MRLVEVFLPAPPAFAAIVNLMPQADFGCILADGFAANLKAQPEVIRSTFPALHDRTESRAEFRLGSANNPALLRNMRPGGQFIFHRRSNEVSLWRRRRAADCDV